MRMKYLFARLLEEAAAGGDPGTGAPEADAPAAGAAPAGDQTVMQATAAAAAPAPAGIPEKYQVKLEDGSIDQAASVAKLSEAYAAAEKRIGSGDLPPKTAGEYAVTVPEKLAGAWDPATDPLFESFRDKAHAKGFTQAQMDLVIEAYGDIAPGLVAGSIAASAEECTTELKGTWKTEAEYQENVGAAARAMQTYGGEEAQDILAKYGNDPAIIRFMARVGKEVAEDKSLDPGLELGKDTIESMEASQAYRDPKDPQHAAVSARIRAYYEKKAAIDAKAGNIPLM